ncbi:hypothetical protein HMPREF1084_04004 [Clostridium butyricum 60E.3]|uniref:hypothetical protein n=1 Tax=Clostridium butyricum TaxID=1492 RepID=UPI0002D17E4B|nr:hypothetical protein [Clostridium butyricum]ENZ30158.1 hypothetical protein HMPREF1084_04004 [Clostridium butyricum 60E.3]
MKKINKEELELIISRAELDNSIIAITNIRTNNFNRVKKEQIEDIYIIIKDANICKEMALNKFLIDKNYAIEMHL